MAAPSVGGIDLYSGRTRSLSPVKDILRFKSPGLRKVQTPVTGLRWVTKGKTIWEVVGGESK